MILDEPTTSMNTAFRSIRNTAGLPHFRIYDCRVQAIAKLLLGSLVTLDRLGPAQFSLPLHKELPSLLAMGDIVRLSDVVKRLLTFPGKQSDTR